jgi:hypothetical protein
MKLMSSTLTEITIKKYIKSISFCLKHIIVLFYNIYNLFYFFKKKQEK